MSRIAAVALVIGGYLLAEGATFGMVIIDPDPGHALYVWAWASLLVLAGIGGMAAFFGAISVADGDGR